MFTAALVFACFVVGAHVIDSVCGGPPAKSAFRDAFSRAHHFVLNVCGVLCCIGLVALAVKLNTGTTP